MRRYSLRTKRIYLYWIKDYIRYHKLQHPTDFTDNHVVTYLSYLAISTQKSALNTLAFLYNQFLKQPLGDLGFKYAKRQQRLLIVLKFK